MNESIQKHFIHRKVIRIYRDMKVAGRQVRDEPSSYLLIRQRTTEHQELTEQ